MSAYLFIILHLNLFIYRYRLHNMESNLFLINYLDKLLEYDYFISL